MKPFIRCYKAAQFFSALITVTVQSFVLRFLLRYPPTSSFWVSFFYLFAASATTYYVFYKFLIFVFETRLWKWRMFLGRYDVSGTWYHEFKSHSEPGYVRLGKIVFTQNALSMSIDAVNYDEDFSLSSRTLWNSTSVTIEEPGRLVISYVAHTFTYGFPPLFVKPPEKTGVMYVTIMRGEGEKPIRLDGIFHDSSPPFRRGTITCWRKAEWQGAVENLTSPRHDC